MYKGITIPNMGYMNGAGKDWTANSLAINIKPIFIRRGTASSITLT